jgi:hypothetical protein
VLNEPKSTLIGPLAEIAQVQLAYPAYWPEPSVIVTAGP